MTFKYNQTAEDFINFNIYYSWKQKSRKKLRIGVYLYLPIVALIVVLLKKGNWNLEWADIIVVGLFSFLALFSGRWYRLIIKGRAKRVLKSGKNKTLLGERELILGEDKITSVTEHSQSDFSWSTVEKIGGDENGFYLFVAANQAFVLPKRIFASEAEEKEMLELVQKKSGQNIDREK